MGVSKPVDFVKDVLMKIRESAMLKKEKAEIERKNELSNYMSIPQLVPDEKNMVAQGSSIKKADSFVTDYLKSKNDAVANLCSWMVENGSYVNENQEVQIKEIEFDLIQGIVEKVELFSGLGDAAAVGGGFSKVWPIAYPGLSVEEAVAIQTLEMQLLDNLFETIKNESSKEHILGPHFMSSKLYGFTECLGQE